jgi:hypothetical protein
MKIRTALLCGVLIAAQACAAGPPTAADDEAIVRALLVDYAQGEVRLAAHGADRTQLCVAPRLDARRLSRDDDVATAGRDEEWLANPGPGAPLPPDLRRRVNAAAGRAMQSPDPARIARIEPAWIPAPLGPVTPASRCTNRIMLSAPSIQDQFAFVLVVNTCGQNCAGGDLHALRREGGEWRPLAVLPLWVS